MGFSVTLHTNREFSESPRELVWSFVTSLRGDSETAIDTPALFSPDLAFLTVQCSSRHTFLSEASLGALLDGSVSTVLLKLRAALQL